MSETLISVKRFVLDNQTRIGIGGTALFSLAGIAAPIGSWWISAPIVLVCGAVAIWGFWPLIRALPVCWRQMLRLTEAARLIYAKASPRLQETIRRESSSSTDGNPIETWGMNKLHVGAAARIISLRGRRGPGLQHEPIPVDELENLWVRSDGSIGGISGTPPNFIDVIVSRSDALRVLRHYEERNLVPHAA